MAVRKSLLRRVLTALAGAAILGGGFLIFSGALSFGLVFKPKVSIPIEASTWDRVVVRDRLSKELRDIRDPVKVSAFQAILLDQKEGWAENRYPLYGGALYFDCYQNGNVVAEVTTDPGTFSLVGWTPHPGCQFLKQQTAEKISQFRSYFQATGL